jgi:response regulator NasT
MREAAASQNAADGRTDGFPARGKEGMREGGTAVIRTVIALESGAGENMISEILERNRIAVRYRCRTGAEVIRAIAKMGGGVVICGYKLPDMTAEELSHSLGECAAVLMIAKNHFLELCEHDGIFKLPIPVRTSELIGSVNMLIQMDQMRSRRLAPRRSPEDECLVRKAKERLLEQNGMTESEAHRYIPHKSMESCMKMTETAKLILAAFESR